MRNNTSSRFGKWIEIHFSDQNTVCGAFIESYLLEKSRVVTQQSNERNFHIFYQLFTSSELCAAYNLSKPEHYRYLYGGKCVSVSGIDDEHCFMDVLDCFEALGFSKEEKDSIFGLLVAILKLGNLQYYDIDPSAMHPHAKVRNRPVFCHA